MHNRSLILQQNNRREACRSSNDVQIRKAVNPGGVEEQRQRQLVRLGSGKQVKTKGGSEGGWQSMKGND
jgi:hypothetical protein